MKSNDELERDILSTLFKHGCIGKHQFQSLRTAQIYKIIDVNY